MVKINEKLLNEYGNIYDYIREEFFYQDKFKEALELLDAEGSPVDLDYCFLKAENYMELGNREEDPEKALEYYSEVVKIVPNWVTVYNNIGLAYYKLGNYEDALANLNKSVQLSDYRYGDAYYNLGYVLYKTGYKDIAKGNYDRACELNPEENYKYYEEFF